MLRVLTFAGIMTLYIQYFVLVLLLLLMIFHLLILLKIVPYQILWGGRLKNDKEMYKFEGFSVLITALFLIIILVDTHYLNWSVPDLAITLALSLMSALFALNTFGNLMSKNKFEKRVFTPVTIALALGCGYLALVG